MRRSRCPRVPWLLAGLSAPALLAYSCGAAAARIDSLVDLSTLSGAQSTATGINNHGQVTGWSNTTSGPSYLEPFHAFPSPAAAR